MTLTLDTGIMSKFWH